MNSYDLRDGQAMFLIIVKEYSGKHDDGAVTMAAQDAIAFNTFTGLGPFSAAWKRNQRAYFDSMGSYITATML